MFLGHKTHIFVWLLKYLGKKQAMHPLTDKKGFDFGHSHLPEAELNTFPWVQFWHLLILVLKIWFEAHPMHFGPGIW